MAAATVLAGLLSGVAGIVLTLILHFVQHVGFGYTENTFLFGVEQAPPWRRVVVMSVGGLIVGLGWWWHRRRFDHQNISVTRALRDPGHQLALVAALLDSVIQVVAVGVGASLGREGAPRQAGAAFAGWINERLRLGPVQGRTLMACGAGAGLGAVYNVPLGGALFTLEILLTTAAPRAVVPALVASFMATAVAWPVLSMQPTYHVSNVHLAGTVVVWAVPAGVVVGLIGVGFVRLMNAARTHAPSGGRAAAAIFVVFTGLGLLAIPYPQLLGNGKGPAQLALVGTLSLGLATVLFVLKPIATAACLRAGAIGGLLTPAVATGALFGVAAGHLWTHLWPGGPYTDFAIVGAAALLAVTQQAPITATVLVLEFLHAGLNLLGPIIIAVGLACLTAWLLDRRLTPTVVRPLVAMLDSPIRSSPS
jgi:H+/Cl- antiporter ClcA